MEENVQLAVSFRGSVYPLALPQATTLGALGQALADATGTALLTQKLVRVCCPRIRMYLT